ncbi:MAG: hypothetical protein HY694_01985, partial [Deltaproteobacteria bacterium]|nr:hypothetical protein [Deltaproteobacteria bacterium]
MAQETPVRNFVIFRSRIAGFLLALGTLVGAEILGWAAEAPKELQVPQEWIEGAKREGKVIVYGSETP